jgi:phosphatidylserine/phosphatidylglycerophosphate/cardiolipin synthase-like enzyme
LASVIEKNGSFSVRAHVGDAKTLLAFNCTAAQAKNLAGFTIKCKPKEGDEYFLLNTLQFAQPGQHAQVPAQPANSSVNAPFQKFRWLHVLGQAHQGLKPFFGPYDYTITPRYFDGRGALTPMNDKLAVSLNVDVGPFSKGSVSLGFTRGFTQSQAFVHHFSKDALIAPAKRDLIFDTSQISGANAQGVKYTYADEYEWMGWTARERIFGLLNEVLGDRGLHLDMFAYDLNEPDLAKILLELAAQGRMRIILDNASLHTTKPGQKVKGKPKPPALEDAFEKAFNKAKAGKAAILRAHFKRFSHDKIFIVSKNGEAQKVMTGSTNFSVTGLYVNSNHVILFDDAKVAGTYQDVFDAAWQGRAAEAAFLASDFSKKPFSFKSNSVPPTDITFSPHEEKFALSILQGIAARIAKEGKKAKAEGNVLFAVMQLDGSDSTVYKALANVHKQQNIFSFGITDTMKGIALYKPGTRQGVLVTGKPTSTVLPPPFDQVPNIGGFGHQVHHKFVVCGFNGDDPVVYCGSSNLASGGEQENGDNLLAIHDGDIATAFAIEAVGLVDHFNFLDRYATEKAKATRTKKAAAISKTKPAVMTQAANDASWHLSTYDKWAKSYFDPKDLHNADRQVFA